MAKEGDVFHMLVHFPDVLGAESGAMNSILVSDTGGGDSST